MTKARATKRMTERMRRAHRICARRWGDFRIHGSESVEKMRRRTHHHLPFLVWISQRSMVGLPVVVYSTGRDSNR